MSQEQKEQTLYQQLKDASRERAYRLGKLSRQTKVREVNLKDSLLREMKNNSTSSVLSRIPAPIKEKIEEESSRIGATQSDMVRILWELYDLEDIDLFITRLRKKYYQGLNAEQIAALSVLYSFLSHINSKTGMLE